MSIFESKDTQNEKKSILRVKSIMGFLKFDELGSWQTNVKIIIASSVFRKTSCLTSKPAYAGAVSDKSVGYSFSNIENMRANGPSQPNQS